AFARAGAGYGKHFDRNRDGERAVQSELLRDLLGDPFRPLPPAPWLPPHVLGLAEECDAGDAELYPVLADALEDIGQDHAAPPPRRPPHPRGCRVIDGVLGRGDGFWPGRPTARGGAPPPPPPDSWWGRGCPALFTSLAGASGWSPVVAVRPQKGPRSI